MMTHEVEPTHACIGGRHSTSSRRTACRMCGRYGQVPPVRLSLRQERRSTSSRRTPCLPRGAP